jgi:hypothetical protein
MDLAEGERRETRGGGSGKWRRVEGVEVEESSKMLETALLRENVDGETKLTENREREDEERE